MADPNAFPNLDTEKLNQDIKKSIEQIKKNLNLDQIKADVKSEVETIKKDLISQGLIKGDPLSTDDRNYVNSLPSDYKNKAELYLDIFRDNPEVVQDYLATLKKWGSEKAAKEAGATNPLFNPSKIKAYLNKNRDSISEDTQKRLEFLDRWGDKKYNLMIREDEEGRRFQKEWSGKWTTKTYLGLGEPVADSARFISKTVLQVAAAVGSENAANAVNWLEANWPRADDLTYPNRFKPFDQNSTYQHLIDELA